MYGLLFASLLPRDAGCDSMEAMGGWRGNARNVRPKQSARRISFLSQILPQMWEKRWKIVKKMINGVKNLIK
jgi:hypothetical protein